VSTNPPRQPEGGRQAESPAVQIRARDISKEFAKGMRALDGVSLEVREREVVTIVGPSGCGKSTLLRILAGLDFPTAGTVEIRGQVVNGVPARERNIAMVFQSYALYPHMTCFENLALNLQLKKTPKAEIGQRVRETARLLEIEELLAKKPRELSGGQRQRVAVGRALIRNPHAFLFDEPLSNLDALLRERVRHELKELFRRIEATVLYVTHDQVEAMTLADRVVVLDQGRVQQIGPPEDLYRRPANRFVASFIGSPSMNLFERRIEEGAFPLGGETVRTGLDWSGDGVVGLRPESVRLAGSGIAADVRWVEHLGGQYLIGVRAGDAELTVTNAQRPASEQVYLEIEPGSIHVFDKNSGANVAMDRTGDSRGL
jgi:sn-glycerol 3-phosphate transport system ATP-binding protein